MSRFISLIMLFSCITYVTHSYVVHQSPGLIIVSPGETVKLSCVFEQTVKYCFSEVTWHKVNLRTGELKNILPSVDNDRPNEKTCVLTLTRTQVQDSGLYYCFVRISAMVYIGNGSRVVVTPDESEPQLSVFSVSRDSSSSVPVQCVVMGLVPSQVRVLWRVGPLTRAGWTESAWTDDTDSAAEYTRAHLSVPRETWSRGDAIHCIVQHREQNFTQPLRRLMGSDKDWLVYVGYVVATFAIIVAVIISIDLCRDVLQNS